MTKVRHRVAASVKKRVASDVKQLHRKWSVRFNALGSLIMGWVFFDPNAALTIYNIMPAEVRGRVPDRAAFFIAFTLYVLAFLSRFVKQKDKTNDADA